MCPFVKKMDEKDRYETLRIITQQNLIGLDRDMNGLEGYPFPHAKAAIGAKLRGGAPKGDADGLAQHDRPQKWGNSRPSPLEFTHFLSDEVRLTPINKG